MNIESSRDCAGRLEDSAKQHPANRLHEAEHSERRYVTNESKAKELDDKLDRISDPPVCMSLRW